MEKRIPLAEFKAAIEASGAKLKFDAAEEPEKALRKLGGKHRDKVLAHLGIPGGLKLTARAEGDAIVLIAEGEDRFFDAADAPKRGFFGRKAKPAKGEANLTTANATQGAQGAQGAQGSVGGAPSLLTPPLVPVVNGTVAGAAGDAVDGAVDGAAVGVGGVDAGKPAKKSFFGRKKPKAKPGAAGAVSPDAAKAMPKADYGLAADGKGPAWKPPLPSNLREVDIYPVNAPHAWVRILHDAEQHEMTYNVLEPPLTEREQRVLSFLEDTLVDVIEIPLSQLTDKQAEAVLLEHVNQVIYDYSILLEEQSKAKLLYYVLRDFLGFGLIDSLMKDDQIEDVSCDGPHVPVFLYHRKHESLKSNVQFMQHEALDGFVIRLAQRSGKHISIAEPLLDATLPGGSRLNSTLSDEVTSGGSTFTIRKFRQVPFTPTDLVRFGTMSVELLAYWWLAVQYGASAIYSGGTASGKTTSLNAILLFIPPSMKIVSIEDTRELNLPHPNWIAGITRSGFGARDAHGRQAGEIDMFTLLKAALRQRPEYILVGEVRGQEAVALFQAMATGHTAYGTMHADSVEAVIHRLENEPINVPRSLIESLDIVSVQIQTRIGNRRVRRTKELVEIVGLDPHTKEILTNTVFLWNPATDQFEYSGVSYVLERIQAERNWSPEQMRQEWEGRQQVLRWLIERQVTDFQKVAKVITAFYKEPRRVLDFIDRDLHPPPGQAVEPLAPGQLPTVIEGAAAKAPDVVEELMRQFRATDHADGSTPSAGPGTPLSHPSNPAASAALPVASAAAEPSARADPMPSPQGPDNGPGFPAPSGLPPPGGASSQDSASIGASTTPEANTSDGASNTPDANNAPDGRTIPGVASNALPTAEEALHATLDATPPAPNLEDDPPSTNEREGEGRDEAAGEGDGAREGEVAMEGAMEKRKRQEAPK